MSAAERPSTTTFFHRGAIALVLGLGVALGGACGNDKEGAEALAVINDQAELLAPKTKLKKGDTITAENVKMVSLPKMFTPRAAIGHSEKDGYVGRVVARDIEPGEEINFNYGPLFDGGVSLEP